MKNDLIDVELDAAVAKALNDQRISLWGERPWIEDGSVAGHGTTGRPFSPSTDWRDGGPILDREPIISGYCGNSAYETSWTGQWYAQLDDETPGGNCHSIGPTRLIAAMRCFILRKTPNAAGNRPP